jgi:hypothetical protein
MAAMWARSDVAQYRENNAKIAESAMPASTPCSGRPPNSKTVLDDRIFLPGFLAFANFDSLAAGLLGAK